MRHIKSSKPHHPNPADLSDRSAACPPGRENSPFALASLSPFAFVSHNICHPVSWIKSSCADCSAGTMATTTQIKTQLSEMKSKWIRTSKSSVHLGLQFCLSTSQITRISLGLPGSSEHRGHLNTCNHICYMVSTAAISAITTTGPTVTTVFPKVYILVVKQTWNS